MRLAFFSLDANRPEIYDFVKRILCYREPPNNSLTLRGRCDSMAANSPLGRGRGWVADAKTPRMPHPPLAPPKRGIAETLRKQKKKLSNILSECEILISPVLNQDLALLIVISTWQTSRFINGNTRCRCWRRSALRNCKTGSASGSR